MPTSESRGRFWLNSTWGWFYKGRDARLERLYPPMPALRRSPALAHLEGEAYPLYGHQVSQDHQEVRGVDDPQVARLAAVPTPDLAVLQGSNLGHNPTEP